MLSIDEEIAVPATAFDHRGFRSWVTSESFPEKLRVTYVDGEVLLQMSPEELEGHNKVKGEITAVLWDLVREGDLGELFLDGALLSNAAAALSCEPDVVFVTWETMESGRIRLVEKAGREDRYIELLGTPDLVVEIVSDSSVRKDLKLLRAAYARAGVPEYWLVDARGDAIRFEILRLHRGAYVPSAPGDRPQSSNVLGRTFTLTRSRNRAGRFRYRLAAAEMAKGGRSA